jgi:DNA ligase-1
MRVMLAATCKNIDDIRLPVMASVKLDGIRAVVVDGVLMSRNMKPIRNAYVQNKYKTWEGCDGELVLGPPNNPDCFRVTTSAVMSEFSPHDNGVQFFVFDNVRYTGPFVARYNKIPLAIRHPHWLIQTKADLEGMEERVVMDGHEGLITRCPTSIYKYGRSTMNEQGMVKIKRFKDAEAVVVGVEELMHNDNPAVVNSRGYTERTSHKANKQGMGTLGALVVEKDGVRFKIGTGFSAADRTSIWRMQDKIKGLRVKFKYLAVGVKDAPRHPVFLGWRLD